ncbi:MAG: hypothetical protein NC305_17105 [Lachnospiraceae bacterium]|nr:hypothetical protein [Butyrivibrio sp.]MCM1343440.1 hypothetical protein [Muribaculaceae bacterium]MCM1412243.1 hypothetical protein [Lachnospiraceae bacterium]
MENNRYGWWYPIFGNIQDFIAGMEVMVDGKWVPTRIEKSWDEHGENGIWWIFRIRKIWGISGREYKRVFFVYVGILIAYMDFFVGGKGAFISLKE